MLYGLWQCRRAEEALGIVRLLYSDTLSVKQCWFGPTSTRCTLWSFLGGEGIQLKGLMSEPESPRAPGVGGGICPLMSCHVRDFVGGVGDRATPIGRGGVVEPSGHGCSGHWVPVWTMAQTRG